MSFRTFLVTITAFAMLAASTRADAARTRADDVDPPPSFEVVVFETSNCLLCRLFRRDVAPRYARSRRHRMAPLRYIDVNPRRPPHPGLSEPLAMLPTAVIMKDGAEIARIEGYTGPELFFQMMSRTFSRLGH